MLRNFSLEEFDVIIQAGQSNSEGCGMGDTIVPFVQSDNIWFLNNDFSISMAAERVWGNQIASDFSLSFAREYIEKGKLLSGRKLLIVRAAIGGTGFLDNHWGMTDDLYLRMIQMIKTALELNPKNKLVAFLWHQGETDAGLNSSKELYFNNLSTLIKSVRTTFNAKTLPFIAGDFVSHWKMENLAICEPVIDATKEICDTIGYAKFIETSELESNSQKLGIEDPIHFCREAIYLLGVKYFNAFCEITK